MGRLQGTKNREKTKLMVNNDLLLQIVMIVN